MVRILSCLAAFVFAVAEVGCVESSAPEPTGYVTVPLIASGAGGVTYSLPFGAALTLSPSQGDGPLEFFLDDHATSQTLQVPPGDYGVALVDSAGDTAVWPLTRVRPDGTTDTVQGTLRLPPTITVSDGQTTALVIRFQVAGIEPVTFSAGTVDTSVEVDETGATSLDFAINAASLRVTFASGSTRGTPAALLSRLPAQDDTGDGFILTAHTTGPWQFAGGIVLCAPATVTSTGTGNQGFVEYVAELPPDASSQLCVQQNSPQDAFVGVSFFRTGPAITPLLSDLGDHQYFLDLSFLARIAAPLIDGNKLDLRPLAGSHTQPVIVAGQINPDTFGGYFLNEAGDATVTLTAAGDGSGSPGPGDGGGSSSGGGSGSGSGGGSGSGSGSPVVTGTADR